LKARVDTVNPKLKLVDDGKEPTPSTGMAETMPAATAHAIKTQQSNYGNAVISLSEIAGAVAGVGVELI